MKERTKEFALRIVRLYASLPKSVIARALGKRVAEPDVIEIEGRLLSVKQEDATVGSKEVAHV